MSRAIWLPEPVEPNSLFSLQGGTGLRGSAKLCLQADSSGSPIPLAPHWLAILQASAKIPTTQPEEMGVGGGGRCLVWEQQHACALWLFSSMPLVCLLLSFLDSGEPCSTSQHVLPGLSFITRGFRDLFIEHLACARHLVQGRMKGTLSYPQGTLCLVEEKEPQTLNSMCQNWGGQYSHGTVHSIFPFLDLFLWQSIGTLGRRAFLLLSHSNSFGARGLSSPRPSYFPVSWSW